MWLKFCRYIAKFFIDLVSSNSSRSSKRFTGMFMLFSITTATLILIIKELDIKANVLTLTITLISVGGMLLGLGVLEKMINKK